MSIREQQILKSAQTLQKISANENHEKRGHFYFVGTSDGIHASLAITLIEKDPEGLKVASLGKKMRTEITKSKFAHGTVESKNKHFIFHVISGNASLKIIQHAFRSILSKEKGLDVLKTKSVIQMANNTEDKKNAGSDSVLQRTEITAAEKQHLRDNMPHIIEAADKFASIWHNTSPSEEDLIAEEERLAELIQKRTDRCAKIAARLEKRRMQLKKASDGEQNQLDSEIIELEERLQKERHKLAADLYVGEDPFPNPIEDISTEMKEIIAVTIHEALCIKRNRLNGIYQEVHDIISTLQQNENNPDWLKKNQYVLFQSLVEKETAIQNFMSEMNILVK